MAESNSPFGPIPDGDDDFVNTLEGLLRRLRERARRKKVLMFSLTPSERLSNALSQSSDLTSTLENVHNLNLQEGPPIHAKETNIPPSTEGGVGRLWTEDFLFEHLEFLHAHSPIANDAASSGIVNAFVYLALDIVNTRTDWSTGVAESDAKMTEARVVPTTLTTSQMP
ncbi:hypothetical protein CC1G_12120 [Coprinopsis cinerea okayama7|uniref:Uncharacterized protein n=1 Tax=Coprinopsis cinerea (strain Okayama-7 / 130 / ATCC MYA-4618 / FGSC 9003) TaxID=240176 RepID=A8PAX5_COPC7|nr:hypothetical protein CC1G_12120 [Coprinopsis cinerea okayama7\|eukprot:XP_001840066.1 hypothetical protein CC1G_12120 [Coprinopsis cinerea okayama7\